MGPCGFQFHLYENCYDNFLGHLLIIARGYVSVAEEFQLVFVKDTSKFVRLL